MLKKFFKTEKNGITMNEILEREKGKFQTNQVNANTDAEPLFFGLSETEIRNKCHYHFDTFELWTRRLINDELTSKYGDDYFDFVKPDGNSIVKTAINKKVESRMKDQPLRFKRKIDAIVMEDLEYFLCREDFYKDFFKEVLEPFFSGIEEVRSVFGRMIKIRNKISHAHVISLHEAVQCICYSNDYIETYKEYYIKKGKEKDFNVPTFIKIRDILGNEFIRRKSSDIDWEIICNGVLDPKVQLRSGEKYKLELEVDQSFDPSDYKIIWFLQEKEFMNAMKGEGNVISIDISNKLVGIYPTITIKLKTNKEWNRFGYKGCDDFIKITLEKVLPPLKDM